VAWNKVQKGKWIVVDGADCLGKSTQLDALFLFLKNRGEKVIKIKEPGETITGSIIREILLNSKEDLPAFSELLLFMADRNITINNIIKPYLDKGYIILSDRHYLSTMVYQHKLKGNNFKLVELLQINSVQGLIPDLTFVFHGKRINQELNDEYERKTNNKHSFINSCYIEFANEFKNHILINANRDKEIVFEEIISNYEKLL
jgi:dTMP kinase